MPITFVAQASAAAASVSLPSGWQPGDLAIVFAHRDGSNTSPTLPSGWTGIQTGGANTNSARSGYRVLQSGDTSSGTWTNGTSIQLIVLRGQNATTPIGNSAQGGTLGTSMTFPAVTFQVTDGTSWAVLMGGHRTATDVNTVGLAGTTNRSGSIGDICAHTAENVTGWSATSKTVNSSSGHREHSIEVLAEPEAVLLPTLVTAPLIPA